MKNSDIHNGLVKKEIRDMIAKESGKFSSEMYELSKTYEPNYKPGTDIWLQHIENTDIKIKRLYAERELYSKSYALYELIKMFGWNEFDVSDVIEKDLEHYMSFIGTKSEYDLLMKIIEGEN